MELPFYDYYGPYRTTTIDEHPYYNCRNNNNNNNYNNYNNGNYHYTPRFYNPPPCPYMDRNYNNYHSTPDSPSFTESIPVSFVGSGKPKPKPKPVIKLKPTRSQSAYKIQKAFREYMRRKSVKSSMKKVLELNRKVDDVERRFLKGDEVELIKCNEFEKFKVSEMLLDLIIKLDCIDLVDDCVRVCRKAVVRKAISLQEKIDSLYSENIDDVAVYDGDVVVEEEEVVTSESERDDETLERRSEMDDETRSEIELKVQLNEENGEGESWECVGEEEDGEKTEKREDLSNDEWFVVKDGSKSKTLFEKMVEDNQRLMKMVVDLSEKNATQTRLIDSLSQRVEQLEQAMNDRLSRKKEKRIGMQL